MFASLCGPLDTLPDLLLLEDPVDLLADGLADGGVLGTEIEERDERVAAMVVDVAERVAKLAGGKGGGRPHMAQASTGEPERAERALEKVVEIVRPMLEQATA